MALMSYHDSAIQREALKINMRKNITRANVYPFYLRAYASLGHSEKNTH